MRQLEVRMLGGFKVFVDSRPIPAEAWVQRRATDLVKLLALASGHRLSRDEVLERLWPKLGIDAAASNLHKAASYARRALGDSGAIVLRGGLVQLAPDAQVITDVERFERGDLDAYGGDLLPDEPYAEWTLGPRAALRERRLGVMRSQGRWEEVLREDPADEEAHRALMRRRAASGDRPAAARQFRLLREELSRLGVEPSEETLALRRELTRGPAVRARRCLHAPVEGRERELTSALGALHNAEAFGGGALLITGPAGIGKTRLLEAVLAEAEQLGFHTLRGSGQEAEGRTPYGPLTEALDPLAGRRPELIGALADRAQVALSRLLPSVRRQDGTLEEEVDRRVVFRAVAELLEQAASERGVVLAIDDLNNADEATAALVHHLARSAAGERILVVAAMCDQAGARRGEAFAATVLGETELFTGNLEAARAHLLDAARLSRELGAVGGESLARMRLGETLLHLGDRAGARAQLEEALELAHISPIAPHLVFLVCGVLLRVPEDSGEALALIDRVETLFDPRWVCPFCPTGYHVAAATVCARAGELERGREFLTRAEFGASRWPGGPWPAAVAEARASLLLAEGDQRNAAGALRRAAEGYAANGQLLGERRAREALERLGVALAR